MLTTVGSGDGLRGGGVGLSASSISSSGSSLMLTCVPTAVLLGDGLWVGARKDGWRLETEPITEVVTEVRGCEATAGGGAVFFAACVCT